MGLREECIEEAARADYESGYGIHRASEWEDCDEAVREGCRLVVTPAVDATLDRIAAWCESQRFPGRGAGYWAAMGDTAAECREVSDVFG